MSKILIIEDDKGIIEVLRMRLISRKFDVICAQDAIEGTKLALEQNPDLIILDLTMPGGGGLEVLKNIKSSAVAKSIPILVLTGQSDSSYKDKAMEAGVDAYLQKPYDVHELIETIQSLIAHKHGTLSSKIAGKSQGLTPGL